MILKLEMIPVTERLPDDNYPYLTIAKGKSCLYFASYDCEDEQWYTEASYNIVEVTHWCNNTKLYM